MAATLILVRHAAHVHLDRVLSGRMPGVPLSEAGRAQAARLAGRLAGRGISRVWTSPIARARETADAIGAAVGAPVEVAEALTEIDFGGWTGRGFDALRGDPDWDRWNAARATARPPEGEGMAEAQARIVGWCDRVARDGDGGTFALVSHADMIRAAVMHVLGVSLDSYWRFDIDPASATELLWGEGWARVRSMNERGG